MENRQIDKISIWQNRAYLILFSSYTISTFGKFFDMLAVMLMFSYVWQAEPWLISLIPVVYAIPHALFSQAAGVFIDKGKKVKIILLADLLSAIFTIILVFTTSPWWMLAVIFIRSTFTVVHFPAQQALVKQIVHPDLIMKAVTLNGTVNQLSKIIGPFLGATIAAAFSPRISFIVYAVLLLLSIGVLFFLRSIDMESQKSSQEDKQDEQESFWESFRNAWRLMFQSKLLVVSTAFTLLAFLAIQLVDAQFAVLTRELFPNNPAVFGWLVSMVGLGALMILLYLNRLRAIKRYGLFLGSSVFLIGIGLLVMGVLQLYTETWMLLAAAFVIGIGAGIFSVVFSYILQVESPEGKIGQMSGMYNSLTGFVLVLAPIAGGFLVQMFGVFRIFQVIGAVTLVIGISGLLFQRVLWKRSSVEKNKCEPENKERQTV